MSLPVASQRVGEFKRVAGVLVSGDARVPRALAIDVPLNGSVVAVRGTGAYLPALKHPGATSGCAFIGTAIFALLAACFQRSRACWVLSLKKGFERIAKRRSTSQPRIRRALWVSPLLGRAS
jgi:hypothetical protein